MEDDEKSEGSTSGRRPKNRVPKPPNPTWADAAKKVLERYDHALPHKKILQIIQDENLKPCGRGTMPLACLNAMLNSNCKGEDALFYRAPGQAACFGLKRNQRNEKSVDVNDEEEEEAMKTSSEEDSPPQPNFPQAPPVTLQQQPIQPLQRQATGSHAYVQKQKELSRSVAVRSGKVATNIQRVRNQTPSTPGSPGAALVAMPPRKPGAALCVMPPRKRSKLDADLKEENSCELKDAAVRDPIRHSRSEPTLSSTYSAGNDSDSETQSLADLAEKQRELKAHQLQRVQKTRQLQLAEQRSRQRQQSNGKEVIPFGSKPPQLPREKKDIEELLSQIKREQEEELQRDSLKSHRKAMQTKLNQNRQSVNQSRQNINQNRQTLSQKNQASKPAKPVASTSVPSPAPERVPIRKPPSVSGFLEVKLKKLKKMSTVDQIRRTKEGKIDLQSPESIAATIGLKSFLNNEMFKQLPASYQYQLMMLLPDVDRMQDKDNIVRMSPNALTNEFFTKACLEWQEKLMEGEFNVDIIQRIKQEEGKTIALDPWKEKFFEPVWGKSSLADPIALADSGFNDHGGSWSTFLRFSENSADDHLNKFKLMQRTLRQKADTEAIRRNLQRKQQLLKSPTLSSKPKAVDNIVKDRSRKAIKRAQLMHKKIMVERQLGDINARLADTIKPLKPEERTRMLMLSRDLTSTLKKINEHAKDSHKILLHNSSNTTTRKDALNTGAPTSPAASSVVLGTIPKTRTPEEQLRQERRKAKAKKRKREREDQDENTRKRDMMQEQYSKLGLTNQDDMPWNFLEARRLHKKKKKEKHKKKKHGKGEESLKKTKERFSTKIAKGPSIFAKRTVPPTPCPCRLEALLICKQCGAFCHSKCINADNLCTLCAPA